MKALTAARDKLVGCVALAAVLCTTHASAATVAASAVDKTGAVLPDVVVYLEPVGGLPANLPAPTDATVAQQGMQFVPYLTTVRAGTKVSFPNRDNMEHHVKSFSEAKEFELKIYSAGTPPPIVFDKVGMVSVVCLLHDWMRGYIYVVDTPFYANTDATGTVNLDNVPEGKYIAYAWHPDMSTYIAPLSQPVTVAHDGTALKFAFDFKPRKRKQQPRT